MTRLLRASATIALPDVPFCYADCPAWHGCDCPQSCPIPTTTATVKPAHTLASAYHDAGRALHVYQVGPAANTDAHWDGLYYAHRVLSQQLTAARAAGDQPSTLLTDARERLAAMKQALG